MRLRNTLAPGRARAEGLRGNEGNETARAGRNGDEAASNRSHASAGTGASQHASGAREIPSADNCAARRGLATDRSMAEGKGEITIMRTALPVIAAIIGLSATAFAQTAAPKVGGRQLKQMK